MPAVRITGRQRKPRNSGQAAPATFTRFSSLPRLTKTAAGVSHSLVAFQVGCTCGKHSGLLFSRPGGRHWRSEMTAFRLPLSGNVSQLISPWSGWFGNSQLGLININLGQSSAPEVEQEILEDVGSYGRQLGRIGDALAVLITHFHPERPLDPKEEKAIRALRAMLDQIGDIKERHDRAAVRAGVDADRAG
jgi:hypothetical protein